MGKNMLLLISENAKTKKGLFFMKKFKKTVTAAILGMTILSSNIPFSAVGDVGLVKTSGGNLNVRSSPSVSASIVKTLPNNSYITIAEKNGNWWKIEYADGKYGYSSALYIGEVDSDVYSVDTGGGTLNVRNGAGLWYSVKDTLKDGEKFDVLWFTGKWAKILYNGSNTGYVHTDFISSDTADVPNGYKSIALNVPYFNQKDSRWANVTLGSSKRTVGNAGCVTTCIAMAESYLYGYSVTPASLAKSLKYSSSGDLYWPESYKAYNSSDYLYKIYNELKSGRPVLVGAKTSSGGQHWVLVTGFTGGDIKASSFKIQDPGKSSRTKLSEFFKDYPVFYKIMTVR